MKNRGLICSGCGEVVQVTVGGKCGSCTPFDPLAYMMDQVLKQKVGKPRKKKDGKLK